MPSSTDPPGVTLSAASGARSALDRAKRRAARRAPASPTEYPRAKRLLDGGLFDPWYYQLQTGGSATATRAAAHFLRVGAQQGLLANPLTDFLATGLTAGQIVEGLLNGSASTWPLRPLISDFQLTSSSASGGHPGGPAGLYLTHAHAGAPVLPLDVTMPWPKFVTTRTRQAVTLKRLLRFGLFDRAHYERQTGIAFASERAAAWHYLEEGEPRGLAPNRLFEPDWYRKKSRTTAKEIAAHYLRTAKLDGWTSPHFHAATYVEVQPEAAEHPGGALGHFLTSVTADSLTVPSPDSGIEPVTWSTLCAAVDSAAARYGTQSKLTAAPPSTVAEWVMAEATPPAGRPDTEIAIVSDGNEWTSTSTSRATRALKTVFAQEHENWTLHVLVTAGSSIPTVLEEAAAEEPRIRLVPTTGSSPAERVNELVGGIAAEWVAFWGPRESWSPNTLSALLGAARPGVGSQGAVKDTSKEAAIGLRAALRSGDALLWDTPRSLAGMLLARQFLRSNPFRPEAEDQYGWDLLLGLEPHLPFVPFLASRGSLVSVTPVASDFNSPAEHVLRAERILDWESVAGRERRPDRVSLLIPTYEDWEMTSEAVAAALENSGDIDVEIVVLDNGSAPSVTAVLASRFAGNPEVVIDRAPRNTNFATGSNLAFAASSGGTVVFLNNDTHVQPGWLPPLLSALSEPHTIGAQPLLVYEDGSIQAAGTVFFGAHATPGHFLANHPVEDLPPLDHMRFPAVTAACVALPAASFSAMHGFDPVFVNGMEDVDLCLRLREAFDGDFAVRIDSLVVHYESKTPGRSTNIETNRLRLLERWEGRLPAAEPERWSDVGLEVVGHAAEDGMKVTGRRTAVRPLVVRPKALVREGPAAGLPRLRWALKVAAHGGSRGDVWGDVAFADDLAAGLRALGQEVVVDRRHAHTRPGADHLDDVALHLRGLEPALAQPGDVTNVMWVISHPDLVRDDELSPAFELIYAAGAGWSAEASARAGREVRTLLQATNPGRFNPDGPRLPGLDVLFVGRTRGVYRPIIRDALAVGAPLTIFGDGWEEFIDPSHVEAHHLPNADLPAAYRGARVVLNDHWDDMARFGFLSNRLFDAAACGTRVVTDPVPGLEETFGPSVHAYRSLDELRALLEDGSDKWSDPDTLHDSALRIAAEHSFDARARTLLADILDVRGVQHELR